MSEPSFADFIFDMIESEGFHCTGFEGKPGEEAVTFVNESGETRTAKFGFTTRVRPTKNHIVKVGNLSTLNSAPQVHDCCPLSPKAVMKVDYSNLNKEGGVNG